MSNFDKKAFRNILIKAKGTRGVNEFATHAGISSSYVSELINLKRSTAPSVNILKNIARVARNNVSLNDLMKAAGYFTNPYELDDLLDDFIGEDNTDKKCCESSRAYNFSSIPDTFSMLPFLINITSSNNSIFDKSNIRSYGYENAKDVTYGTYFYYSAPDNSMLNSKISRGDTLTIKYQSRLENNKIFLILLHEELTLREVHLKEDYIVFTANNPKFEPEVFNADDLNAAVVDIIGKVTCVKIKF